MANEKAPIRAEMITSPIQLLAACLILIIVIEGSFLSGAATIHRPAWAAGLLVICAVLYIPVILAFLFILQTKYRPELMADSEYRRLQVTLSAQSSNLQMQLQQIGFNLDNVVREEPAKPLTTGENKDIDRSLEEVQASLPQLEKRAPSPAILSNALLQAAKALLAQGRWHEAASYLDEYVTIVSDDWEVQFSRGLAHANSRAGVEADIASLRAYNEAIALAPPSLDPDMRSKLYSYRGAMAKRLHRFSEAEADLLIAEGLAQSEERLRDIDYNLAGVYAMTDRREESLLRLRRLSGSPLLGAVKGHAQDYFASMLEDPDFKMLLASMN